MSERYLLLYDFVADYLERRVPLRPEHLALLQAAHERGELLMAGPHDDDGAFDGALLVFQGDRAVVERFVAADPYPRAGLVTRVRIRRWTLVIQ
ncbi:MAG TPA: YciI family protein [Kofleriaceae bacterium]